MKMRGLRVGARIGLGFSLVIVVMIASAGASYLSLSRIQRTVDSLFTVELPAVDYLDQADRDLQQLLVAERSMLLAQPGSDVFKEQKAAYDENFQQSTDSSPRRRPGCLPRR